MTKTEFLELVKISGIALKDDEIVSYMAELEEMMNYLTLPDIAEEIIDYTEFSALRKDTPKSKESIEKESEEFYWVPKIF